MSARPTVSLCLIARDEEAMLPGCLASVAGAVDQVVVVDTGSGDRTREVARAAGALVLERPWDDDFSAPRNLAARHATGDWILVLDADERLAPGAGEALRRQLAAADFDVGLLRLHNASRRDALPAEVVSGAARQGSPALLPRVVRNAGAPEWQGVIHENVGEWLLRRGGRRGLLDVDVAHLGALPSVRQARAKGERNVALLRRRAAGEPGDVTPAGYLALELLELGRLDEAHAEVERAWALVPSQPAWRCLHRLGLSRALLALRASDAARAQETAAVAEARNGPHPDWDYLRGAAAELRAQAAPAGSAARRDALAEAEAALLAAQARLAGPPVDFTGLALPGRLLLHLGQVRLQRGDAPGAAAALEALLRLEPGHGLARVGLAEAALLAGDAAGALARCEPLLGGPAPDGWVVAALGAERLGAAADARLLAGEAARRAPAGFGAAHRAEALAALRSRLGGPAGGAQGGRP